MLLSSAGRELCEAGADGSAALPEPRALVELAAINLHYHPTQPRAADQRLAVAQRLAHGGEVQLGLAIEQALAEAVAAVFDFRPAAIIDVLQLRRPQYRALAAYGHIGREDVDVAFEKTDRIDALRAFLKL